MDMCLRKKAPEQFTLNDVAYLVKKGWSFWYSPFCRGTRIAWQAKAGHFKIGHKTLRGLRKAAEALE